jgi:hypothetical protein
MRIALQGEKANHNADRDRHDIRFERRRAYL